MRTSTQQYDWWFAAALCLLGISGAKGQVTYDTTLFDTGSVVNNWTEAFYPADVKAAASSGTYVFRGFTRYVVTVPPGYTNPNLLLTLNVNTSVGGRGGALTSLDCDPLNNTWADGAPATVPLAGRWSVGSTSNRIDLYISSNDRQYPAFNSSKQLSFACAVATANPNATSLNYTLVARVLPSNVTLVQNEQNALNSLQARCCLSKFAGCDQWQAGSDFSATTICKQPQQICLPSGNLYRLDLSMYNLGCDWPADILSQFSQLAVLRLADNVNLKGNITNILGTISKMRALQLLDLSLRVSYISNIQGEIDSGQAHDDLCNSVQGNLTNLDLSGIGLSGAIPRCLMSSPAINTLNLGRNNFTGTIPDSIPAGSALQNLILDSNRLSGSLPASLANASALNQLSLSGNVLQGIIPVGLGSLSTISLAANNLTGTIPNDIGTSLRVASFNASHNRLTSLPAAWTTATNNATNSSLMAIDVSNNTISGRFPVGLVNAPALRNMSLGSNNLTGALPANNSMFPALINLVIANNSLTGSIPEQFGQTRLFSQASKDAQGNSATQTLFNASYNIFSGSLPSFLASLPTWTQISIQGNPGLAASCANASFSTVCKGLGSGAVAPAGTQSPPVPISPQSAALPALQERTGADEKSSLSGGALAGIVVGALAGVALLGFLAFLVVRKRRANFLVTAPSGKTLHHEHDPWAADLDPKSSPLVLSLGANDTCSGSDSQTASGELPRSAGTSSSAASVRRGSSYSGGTIHDRQAAHSQKPSSRYGGSSSSRSLLHSPQNGQPQDDWQLEAENVILERDASGKPRMLGSGAFGAVYKATVDGVTHVAVKTFHGVPTPQVQADFLKEVAILKSCRHCNIVQFYGACMTDRHIMLVTEFMAAGDLWSALRNDSTPGVFSWNKRGRHVAIDVAHGLHYLHSRKVVHFDLKSPNVLLTRDLSAKISDVGLAHILSNTHLSSNNRAIGTFAWAAPELLSCTRGTPVTEKVDIYSYGVLLWEVVTRERPQRGQLRFCRVPEECPQEVEDLIESCMSVQPERRPTCMEIVEILESSKR